MLGRASADLVSVWKKRRQSKDGSPEAARAFIYQTGRIFTYKLFLEVSFHLLNSTGRAGVIVPSGLYTDSWSLPLRALFLDKCNWDWLVCFENRKKIFDIHGSFKFAVIIVDRKVTKIPLKAAFMLRDLELWERNPPAVFELDRNLIPLFSPDSRSIPEVRSQRDLTACKRIYEHSLRLGENADGWKIDFAIDFMMNSDARLFPPIKKWVDEGYLPDVYDRWIGPKGEVALPLFEGRMIGQFDFSQKGWISGKGRTAVWIERAFSDKRILPQYLISEIDYKKRGHSVGKNKFVFMRIGSSTNTRTLIGTALCDFGCGDTASTLTFAENALERTLILAAGLTSLTFDFVCRQRVGGLHVDWFLIAELPIAKRLSRSNFSDSMVKRLMLGAAALTFLHRRFAPEWLRLKSLYPKLSTREWKHWWAVTEADRLRLRVELDALCADAYGLDPDDFDWIVRDDPTDPKGFWRVDKTLPYRERLTGLAAAAFRALKEGKWSADSAASLSNDAFFALLGIPELTSAPAAQAKGLSQPLIQNRAGCHRWEPETFAADDPRHGWTWEHCHADAVALLGSEQAVADYIAGTHERAARKKGEEEEFKLRGEGPKQRRLFE